MFAIDAHSLVFQVFHAIPMMTSPTGQPTNAVFGFTRDLLWLRQEKKPDYLLVAFDLSGPTFRDQLFDQYKANRSPMPEDLESQIPMIRQLLDAMNVPVLECAGYEADDVLATLAVAGERQGLDVCLCSADKDLRQLLSDRVRLFNLRKHEFFDVAGLAEDWGVRPDQVVDLQTLVGDPVDNIPGVKGVGVKTAAKLLRQYGTLDNLYAHLDEISSAKLRENLRAFHGQLETTRSLVRLATDVPLQFDWEAWRLKEWNAPRLLALFQEWGFHRFANEVRAAERRVAPRPPDNLFDDAPPPEVERPPDSAATANGTLRSNTVASRSSEPQHSPSATASTAWHADYRLVDGVENFDAFLAELRGVQRFAVDLETTSLDPRRAEIVGLAFCWQPGRAYYIPLRGPKTDRVLNPTRTLEQLKPIFEDPDVAKVNQNVKYDALVLRNHGIALAPIAGDPMVADYLLNAGERSHGLDDLAHRYLGHQVIPITDLIGKKMPKGRSAKATQGRGDTLTKRRGASHDESATNVLPGMATDDDSEANKETDVSAASGQLTMDQVPTAKVAEYAGEDADCAWRLAELLEAKLVEENLDRLYRDLEVPLISVLADMEHQGIRLDLPLLERLDREMAEQLTQLEREIHMLAGRKFNVASPKQLREVLFVDLKLPTQRKTGVTGEASTNQEALEKLAALGYALPRKILEHRQVAKLKGTYVETLPRLVNPKTGRVHASFNQTVAATGRLSSSDPNLQNIPVRTEQGRQIRQAFVPEPGWVLLTADYSQIELRFLAHFAGDEAMQRAFAENRDIHTAVAAEIYGVTETDVTSAMRRVAKTVNFGVIYGMSAPGLAQRLGIPRDEAVRFIDAYFARYPRVASYQQDLLARCFSTQFVTTILGRRRRITGIRAHTTYHQRNQPEREAINMQIQGSAADLIKMAMLNIHRRLQAEGWRTRMLMQIHDELVFETPPEELSEAAALVEKEMTAAMTLSVPLKVDVAAGPNWLDVEEIRHG
jgi:DNA polymerase-1